MKAALLTGIRQFEIREVPSPKIIKETDVLVKIKTVGVCGSDIHYYTTGRIGSRVVQFPFVIGHEAAGIVQNIGNKVTRVKPGQRIAIDPAVSCGHCDQCKAGRENTCRELLFLGCPTQLDGSLAEYIVTDERSCFPIKDDMTFDQAAISEPLAIGVYSVERSILPQNADAAILGIGPIGMSVFHVLRTKIVGNIYVTDKLDRRLEFCKMLNPKFTGNPDKINVVEKIAELEPLMMDVVYECSGDPAAIAQGIQLLKPGGTLVIVGIPEVDEITFPIHELRRKEITIVNIRRQVNCTQKAIDLLASGKINMDSMATHHFSLEEIQSAFELVANYRDGVMKAIINLD
ncbi:MAG: alcohol dehydrogenase catalytic domain-containing protein [Ignavibacteriaceae bacterium]|nr:alcohol dehydrogenase catalytic domain-containing protein [Ignavibacteriaceae bacterium]